MGYHGIEVKPLPPTPSLEEQIRSIVREELAAHMGEPINIKIDSDAISAAVKASLGRAYYGANLDMAAPEKGTAIHGGSIKSSLV
jgi:hypothetical protein